jgi:hypothetical protein
VFDNQRLSRTFRKPNFPRKLERTLARQDHVPAILHDSTRQLDGILDSLYGCHSTGTQQIAIHDRRIHFHFAVLIERRTNTGVEERVIFKNHHSRFGRIQCRSPLRKNIPGRQRRCLASFEPLWQRIVPDRTGAAMNDYGGFGIGHNIQKQR